MSLSFAPLERAIGTDVATHLGAALGVDHNKIRQYREDGLTPGRADELAIRIGQHPIMVWGQEWYDALDEPLSPSRSMRSGRTADDLREVHALRMAGVSFADIARQLGWRDSSQVSDFYRRWSAR